jgi:CHAT domain-containing protein
MVDMIQNHPQSPHLTVSKCTVVMQTEGTADMVHLATHAICELGGGFPSSFQVSKTEKC